MNREYHVAMNGSDLADGTREHALRTISRAAELAEAGDKIIVHEGEYREWVKPARSGLSSAQRIVYEAAAGEKVIIKGSERIQTWSLYEGTVWKVSLSNEMFAGYNPYKETIGGDWLEYPTDPPLHTGEVYMNGISFFEAPTLEAVLNPVMRTEAEFTVRWQPFTKKLFWPERTLYRWYVTSDEETTTIYANFQGADPNQELTEINVRKCCFYPEKTGMNYITVRGFEMAQAACPWTPPTEDQPALLGANWSKGWIIEDNIIHDAKCSGISIGKESSTSPDHTTTFHRNSGYQRQMEAVFRAAQHGWSKETIGSHIIRNNTIFDCGQNGIVGHLGCIFSKIYRNHIYNIGVKKEFSGHEIAAIKLHAAIDVQIYKNNIHSCTLGTWLDWQAQGTRISKNFYHDNERDFMIEVTHGPCLFDNNIFASKYNFDNLAQGSAFVNNLCCGIMRPARVMDRSTPYHFPHTIQPAGSAFVYGGDDRLYNNIFVGGVPTNDLDKPISASYNGCTTSIEEYIDAVQSSGHGDAELYAQFRQAVFINHNCYLDGAEPFEREKNLFIGKTSPQIQFTEENGQIYLEMTVAEDMLNFRTPIVDTGMLGISNITDEAYEAPDGSPITLDTDYLENGRFNGFHAGPFADLKPGLNRIKVWG